MLQIRRGADRGHFDHGWLDTWHTFTFADYFDPKHMGFRTLRVMNEDRVQPGAGFGMHGHRDMEILTHVLEGALEHKDSMGNGSVLRAGEWQHMTAGRGIRHSEFNPSGAEPVHLYQIWIEPDERGLPPGYEERSFPAAPGGAQLVASPDGRNESLRIHQDAFLYRAALPAGESMTYPLAPGRHAWLQVLRGDVQVNGQSLSAGDGAALSDEQALSLRADRASDVLWFDLN